MAKIKQGYKQTDIGVIPEDWKSVEIANYIDFLTGFPFPSNGYVNDGIRLVRGSNIKRGKTDWSEEITQYWKELSSELSPYVLKEGDIVIAMDGSLVGRSFAQISTKDLPSLLLQRVARIRSSKIELSFLKEAICNEYFTLYCDKVKTTSAIPHISPSDIKNYTIALPPTKKEQEAIATALSDIDSLIDEFTKLINKKRSIKEGAMQQLLSPKEGWIKSTLGKIAKIYRGASPRPIDDSIWFDENSSIGWVRISDVTAAKKWLIKTTQKLSPSGVKNSRFIKRNNLIMSICATVGRPIITKIDVCIHDGFVVFDEPKIDMSFLYYFLMMIEDDWSKAGQTGSQTNLNTTLIQEKEIYFSKERNEQKQIASILSDMDSEIEVLEQNLLKYKAIKTGMMQQLLTGQIRLI